MTSQVWTVIHSRPLEEEEEKEGGSEPTAQTVNLTVVVCVWGGGLKSKGKLNNSRLYISMEFAFSSVLTYE